MNDAERAAVAKLAQMVAELTEVVVAATQPWQVDERHAANRVAEEARELMKEMPYVGLP